MAEMKFEKPLEYYTVDNFIEECRKLIGQPVHGVAHIEMSTYDSANIDYIAGFAGVLGNSNPVYRDLAYAVRTRYATVIAPPTFLVAFKYPISYGALFDGPYPLVGFEAAFDWEWNDVIRMNDSFTAENILKNVYERPSDKGRVVYLVSDCRYFNALSNKLVATCRGTYAAIARAESITDIPDAVKEGFGKYLVTDRKVYHYSDEEVERIVSDMKKEEIRGSQPLYWEDVNVGDKLTPVVKFLTTSEQMHYFAMVFGSKAFPTFELRYRRGLKTPGFLRMNSVMGYPYDIEMNAHMDPNMSGTVGMPDEYALGTLRAGLCTHLLSNWMGDDGFIRRLSVDVLEPYIYGDCLWIGGRVVEKYKEKLGGELYGAVDIKLEVVNQLGKNVQPGRATVYLPSPGLEVKLPIPQ